MGDVIFTFGIPRRPRLKPMAHAKGTTISGAKIEYSEKNVRTTLKYSFVRSVAATV